MTVEQAAAIHQVAVSRCERHARMRDNANAVIRWAWVNPWSDDTVFWQIAREQERERVKWLEIADACAERIESDPTLNAYLRGHRG